MRSERSLPIPGHSLQAFRVESGHGLCARDDAVGRIAIGADLERVFALQLEQVGNLAQRAGDGQVIEAVPFTCKSVGFDAEVEQSCAACGQRVTHRAGASPGGVRQNRHPPPPAPQTLAA